MEIIQETDHLLMKTDSKEHDLKSYGTITLYRRRWWVIFVFSFAGLSQALIWDTWGPIAESSELVFGWTDATIAQITNMSSIVLLISVVPVSSFMEKQGLRASMLLCSTVLCMSAFARCFTMDPDIFTPLAYMSACLHGIACAIPFSGPAVFASVWFPVKERTLASGIVALASLLGVAIAFLIGPQLVPSPSHFTNSTFAVKHFNIVFNSTNTSQEDPSIHSSNNNVSLKMGIEYLMYTYAAIAGLLFIFTVIYFPAKPPTPPSITAALPRRNNKDAFKAITRNVQLWVIVIVGSVPRGVLGAWIAVIDVVVKPLGVSQVDAGWAGFCHVLFGSLARISFTKVFDMLGSRRKVLLIAMHAAALTCCIWVALICDGTISMHLTSLYVSLILLSVFVNGSVPLFFELAAEAAYPTGEGIAGGLYVLVLTVVEILFFGILSIPDIGVSWMTWACVGSLCFTLPLLVMFKDTNTRNDIDMGLDKQ